MVQEGAGGLLYLLTSNFRIALMRSHLLCFPAPIFLPVRASLQPSRNRDSRSERPNRPFTAFGQQLFASTVEDQGALG